MFFVDVSEFLTSSVMVGEPNMLTFLSTSYTVPWLSACVRGDQGSGVFEGSPFIKLQYKVLQWYIILQLYEGHAPRNSLMTCHNILYIFHHTL